MDTTLGNRLAYHGDYREIGPADFPESWTYFLRRGHRRFAAPLPVAPTGPATLASLQSNLSSANSLPDLLSNVFPTRKSSSP